MIFKMRENSVRFRTIALIIAAVAIGVALLTTPILRDLNGAASAQSFAVGQNKVDFFIPDLGGYSDAISPGQFVEVNLSYSLSQMPDTGTVTLTLPPYLTYLGTFTVSHGMVKRITSSGQTVTVEIDKDDHPYYLGSITGSNIFLHCRVKSLSDLPEAAPEFSIPAVYNFVRPGETATLSTDYDFALLYSKITQTRSTSEPVDSGEVISYTIRTTGYEHFTMLNSRIVVTAPSGTDMVPGSLGGDTGGATVTTSGTSRYTLDWTTNPPRGPITITYQVKVRERGAISPTVTELTENAATYRFTVRTPYANNTHQRVFNGTAAGLTNIPLKSSLLLELTAGKKSVPLNGEFDLDVHLDNKTPWTLFRSKLDPTLIQYEGEGLAQFVSQTPAEALIQPGQTATIKARFKGTREGKFKISGIAEAWVAVFGGGELRTRSVRQFSPEICVGCADIALTIDLPDERLQKGDDFPSKVTVELLVDEPRTVNFVNAIIRELPLSGDPKLTVEEHELPPPFVLTPENRTRTFEVMTNVAAVGVTELESQVAYTGAGGVEDTVRQVEKVSVSPFEIAVEITPTQTVLDLTPSDKKSEKCRLLENLPTVNNCIEIVVKVKNISDQTISSVNIPNAVNPLSLINEIDPKILGEPLTLIEHQFPQTPVTLEKDQEATWTWRMNAYDAPAFLEFEPTVFGAIAGEEVSGHANKKFRLLEKILLKWGMKPANGTSLVSGTNVRTEGYLENVSGKDCQEGQQCPQGKKLRVMVHSKTLRNAGGGFVAPATYDGPAPDRYHVFDLPYQGDEKRVAIKALFNSVRSQKATSAEITFKVRLWIVEDDGKLTFAEDQVELDDEYTDEIFVRYSPEQIPVDGYKAECLQTYRVFVCSMLNNFYNDAIPGAVGLFQFGMRALQHGSERNAKMSMLEASAQMATVQTVLEDENAKSQLMLELYEEYVELHNKKVLEGQDIDFSKAPMALGEFTLTAIGSLGRFIEVIDRGDMEEIEDKLGGFLGSNPDLLLEPLVIMRTYLKLNKALGEMAEGTADNVYSAAEKASKRRQEASLDERVAEAKAKPGDPDLAKALLPGDTLTAKLLIEIFGVDQDTVRRLQKISDEAGVVLAFRARSARASELLRMNLAWPKPQALKQKCVNKLDTTYLGYPEDSYGKIHIVEPPAALQGKTGKELKEALDEHMEKLSNKPGFEDLKTNEELYAEVRDRIETRTKEWADYTPKLKLDNPDADHVEVMVNFDGPFQWVRDMSGDIGGKEKRKIYHKSQGTLTDPATGEPVRQWEITMDGPGGQGPRWVTGDIDFLGILDLNGNFINDTTKRIAVYKALVEAQLMEHGESMSARLNKAREEYLKCCVFGTGEGMLTIGPWGQPRVGFFVDNRSVMQAKNAAFKQTRTTEFKRDAAGKIEFDENWRPKRIEYRMENPSGEFLLVNGLPTLRHVDEALVRMFTPTLWEDVVRVYFLYKISTFFPAFLKDHIEDKINSNEPSSGGAVFNRGGPIVGLEPVSPVELRVPDQLRIWTISDGWKPATPEEVLAAGHPGVIDFAPYSVLRENSVQGSAELVIAPLSEMEATGDFFAAGDFIVINPGGANQEMVEIESVQPFVLKTPLGFEHSVGEMVAWIAKPASGSMTVSGRVLTPNGNGLRNAVVTITDGQGVRRTVLTSSAGFYSFDNVASGQNTVAVVSKRYRFSQKVLQVSGDLTDVDFVGLE